MMITNSGGTLGGMATYQLMRLVKEGNVEACKFVLSSPSLIHASLSAIDDGEMIRRLEGNGGTNKKLGFKKVHPDAKLPSYAHEGDAGMDVCAVEDVKLRPFTPILVRTGLIAEIPEGYELQVRPRSGLALKQGITVFNSPGTVDSGYKGEVGIILLWSPQTVVYNSHLDGRSRIYEYIPMSEEEEFHKTIHKGDRIAQLVLAPVTRADVVEVSEVSDTERGTGGFGSTGR